MRVGAERRGREIEGLTERVRRGGDLELLAGGDAGETAAVDRNIWPHQVVVGRGELLPAQRGAEVEAEGLRDRRHVRRGPGDSRRQGIRPAERVRGQRVDGVEAVGEDLSDAAEHVGLGAQVGALGLRQVGPLDCGVEPGQRRPGRRGTLQQGVRPRDDELDPWPGDDQPRRELGDDPEQRGHPGAFQQVGLVKLDQIDRTGRLARGEGVVDGLVQHVVLGEPGRRDTVQAIDLVGPVALQSRAQVVAEQVVVPEPGAVGVDALQEQPARLDLLEHGLPAPDPGQRRGEAAAGPLGDRGQQQELQHRRIQRVQDVLGQEFADVVVAPGQMADQLRRVRSTPQRQRRQLQRRDPPVGGRGQRLDVRARQAQSPDIDQQGPRLRRVEAQRGRVDHDQLVAHPQPAQRQPGPRATGHDHTQPFPHVVQQERQRGDRLVGADPMPVVDHQRDAVCGCADPVHQRGQDVACGLVDVRGQDLPQVLGQHRTDPADRLDQVRQEPHDIVVVLVDRQPGDLDALAGQHVAPLRGERALAEPAGRLDQRQPAGLARTQRGDQPIPGYQRHRRRGR